MKKFNLVLALLFMLPLLIPVHATTVTTSQPIKSPTGQRHNGYAIFSLPAPALDTTNHQLITPVSSQVPVVNGLFSPASFTLPGNDTLSPKMYYNMNLYSSSGRLLSTYHYYISGTTFDIGTAPLTPVTTSNVSIQDLTGMNSLSTTSLCYKQGNLFATVTVSSSCGYSTWSAALAACPSSGCVLDGRGSDSPSAIGSFDPGSNSKDVIILLGPYAYTVDHFTLRAGMHILGAGYGTTITSVGSNSQAMFVIPQSNAQQITMVELAGFRAIGAAGNTSQEGIQADCSTLTNSGLVYSSIHDVQFTGFVGSSIHLKGRPDNATAANQFLRFANIYAARPSGSNPVLKLEGYNGQISFYDSEFDGAAIGDGTNIYIGAGSGAAVVAPLTTYFRNLTSQNGTVAINSDGAQILEIDGLHDENTYGSILVSNPGSVGAAGNQSITIHDSYFAGNVGVNSGNGYLLSVTDGNASIKFYDNAIYGTPDSVCKGTSNPQVKCRDNRYPISPSAAAPTSGITQTLTPAATLDVKGYNHAFLSASGTSITTMKGSQTPGETIQFTATGGTSQFATGGNISLADSPSPFVLFTGDTATFMRVDAGSSAWVLIAYTNAAKQVAYAVQTGKTTAIGSTTLVTSIAANTLYMVNGEVACDSASAAATATYNVTWTDPSNTAQTAGVTATCTALGANSRANIYLTIQVKASTAIAYNTTIANTPTYDLRMQVMRLGSN